jgi:hypothetical protein
VVGQHHDKVGQVVVLLLCYVVILLCLVLCLVSEHPSVIQLCCLLDDTGEQLKEDDVVGQHYDKVGRLLLCSVMWFVVLYFSCYVLLTKFCLKLID